MFNIKHKGYGLLLPTIACAALIGGVAVGITKMSNVSVKAVTSTKTKYTGQQYALNTADKYCRLTNYASLAGFEKRKIDGSDDYYEEVIVTDNTVPLYQGSVETGSAPSKDITVNVYHKEGERMPLVSTIKLYRTDPATFDPSFNMVANDAASTSENQALSANAFREMLNSKVSGGIAFGSDVAMSANASKLYIDSVLKNYALTDSSVGIKDLNDAGTAHRGVYVDAEGFIKPTDIIIRGNKSTEADPLILIPVKLPDGSWAFDSLRKSKLGKGANQTYTVSIKQTPNQTITVTTSDGTKHTSDFTAKIGTTWIATVNADTGYNAGKLIASSGTVNGATTVSATEATIKTFDFNITQSANQTITVTTGDGVKHTSSFTAKYGTTWTAQVVADSGYTAGTIRANYDLTDDIDDNDLNGIVNQTSGTVFCGVSIDATNAVLNEEKSKCIVVVIPNTSGVFPQYDSDNILATKISGYWGNNDLHALKYSLLPEGSSKNDHYKHNYEYLIYSNYDSSTNHYSPFFTCDTKELASRCGGNSYGYAHHPGFGFSASNYNQLCFFSGLTLNGITAELSGSGIENVKKNGGYFHIHLKE